MTGVESRDARADPTVDALAARLVWRRGRRCFFREGTRSCGVSRTDDAVMPPVPGHWGPPIVSAQPSESS
jgi:hypothetical protein